MAEQDVKAQAIQVVEPEQMLQKISEDQTVSITKGVIEALIEFDKVVDQRPRIMLSVLGVLLILSAIMLKVISGLYYVSMLSSVEFVVLILAGIFLSLLASFQGDKSRKMAGELIQKGLDYTVTTEPIRRERETETEKPNINN